MEEKKITYRADMNALYDLCIKLYENKDTKEYNTLYNTLIDVMNAKGSISVLANKKSMEELYVENYKLRAFLICIVLDEIMKTHKDDSDNLEKAILSANAVIGDILKKMDTYDDEVMSHKEYFEIAKSILHF